MTHPLKFSELTNAGVVQAADTFPLVRGISNLRADASQIAAYVQSTLPPAGVVRVPFFCPHPVTPFGAATVAIYAPIAGTITRVAYAFWATSTGNGADLEIVHGLNALVNATNIHTGGSGLVGSTESQSCAVDDPISINNVATGTIPASGGGITGYVEFTPA